MLREKGYSIDVRFKRELDRLSDGKLRSMEDDCRRFCKNSCPSDSFLLFLILSWILFPLYTCFRSRPLRTKLHLSKDLLWSNKNPLQPLGNSSVARLANRRIAGFLPCSAVQTVKVSNEKIQLSPCTRFWDNQDGPLRTMYSLSRMSTQIQPVCWEWRRSSCFCSAAYISTPETEAAMRHPRPCLNTGC